MYNQAVTDHFGAGKPVPALVRASEIMDFLAKDPTPRGISDLARELGMPRSTVHSLCRTLASVGMLSRVGTAQFAIGPHVLSWADAFSSQNSVTQAFNDIALRVDRPEAFNLSILDGREVMYIACRPGPDPLGVRFREGMRFPAPFGATGKAMLSTMSDAAVAVLFDGAWPPPVTPRSVPDLAGLLTELAETRRRGYSIDDGQLRTAMVCCGAPIFSAEQGRTAIAGVAIAHIASDDPKVIAADIGPVVAKLAADISVRLGGQP
jgi:DNA-binding IclR family transcriptional regulator